MSTVILQKRNRAIRLITWNFKKKPFSVCSKMMKKKYF